MRGKLIDPKAIRQKVKTHDFPDPKLGKAVPYGVYDIHGNEAGVSVGISHDTAEFAVGAIRRWWEKLGQKRYGRAKRLLVTADSGGSNSSRCRLWKVELQKWADETGLIVEVSATIRRGQANGTRSSIGCSATLRGTGRGRHWRRWRSWSNRSAPRPQKRDLEVHAWIDEGTYEKGRKVSDEELAACNIKRNEYHGEWNYEIHPRVN